MNNLYLRTAQETLKKYSSSLGKISVVLITGGFERITSVAIYRCPCVNPFQLEKNCKNFSEFSSSCTVSLNFWYGLSLILAPAFALFVFSILAQPRIWKCVVGFCKKDPEHKRSKVEVFRTVILVIMKALISPATWICIALIDGKYLACMLTALPYDVGSMGSSKTCQTVNYKPGVRNIFR